MSCWVLWIIIAETATPWSLRLNMVWLRAVTGKIKLALAAGKANPAPPVGPALGSKVIQVSVAQGPLSAG